MKDWKKACALMLAVLMLFLCTACRAEEQQEDDRGAEEQNEESLSETAEIAGTEDIDDVGMIEDASVYDDDDPDSIAYFYVTVRRGDEGSETDHSFAEVNNVVRFLNSTHVVNDVYAKAIVQAGDENGPREGMLGFGQTQPNAKIRIRGNSSTVKPQKSYKLDLDKDAGLWRGQSNIALNKHVFDVTRMKNKIYYDMLKGNEDVPSCRTQFVRLFIKDETSGKTQFEDYGLYTQVEVPNKKYLANRGLDKEGYLYKAISFNFEPKEGLKNFDDPNFDQEAFDAVLSCKGREDNQKLIDLVEKINDTSININDIVGRYIDRDNYLTWLAYNILTANIDTTEQNFYLYSPTNSEKWFFIPWDSDSMLHVREDAMEGQTENYGNWEHGISNYWGVILHRRFLKSDENRSELADKVDELYQTFNKVSVDEKVKEFNAVIEPYVLAMPDIYYLEHTKEERDTILSGLGDEVEESYQAFRNSLYELMPFFMYESVQEGTDVVFSWEDAYDFDNQEITYHLTVSRRPDMTAPVIDEQLKQVEYRASNLEPGTYYFRVTAAASDGRTSMAMNKITVGDVFYPGVDTAEVK